MIGHGLSKVFPGPRAPLPDRTRYANLRKLSESAGIILDCFRSGPEKFLKVADLEKQTSLPRRTLQYNLKTPVDMESLQRLAKGAGSRYQLVF